MCGTGQFSQETRQPYSSTLGASSVGHIVSWEEGHRPPHPSTMSPVHGPEPQSELSRAQTPGHRQPRESGSLKTRLCLSPKMPFSPHLLGFLCAPLGCLEQRVGWGMPSLYLNPLGLGGGWDHHTSSDRVNPLPHVSLNQHCIWSIKHNWAEKKGTRGVQGSGTTRLNLGTSAV